MTQSKSKVKTFYDPIYGFTYYVAFGDGGYGELMDLRKSLAFYDGGLLDKAERGNGGLCYCVGSNALIWVESESNIPILARECFRAMKECLYNVGVEMSSIKDEVADYYIEFLMRKILAK